MEVQTACTRGRPREFDTERALAAALSVFWTKGYEGASMADLTEAMGITKPSLYAAFGNKEALFTKALDLYEREKLAYVGEALKAATARGVAEHFLRGALEMYAGELCRGCLTVIGASACGDEAEGIREQVVERGAKAKQALFERFERAKRDGDLPDNVDAIGLASYLTAMLQGMSIQAGAGASREELERLVETCLATWPSR
ncbi:MAG: TetR/AcrR family transcriptional regulator [Candidatus Andeanibacterium colombiense]|uniref:TetR/AcrR family transcriptional regulator n=1 Tax=Candidatus Andeanibacterium colombiense TaxID=3121345 RepID=A0AAJ6BMN0_9SPHN|nr:MAG: TetR/AcrR family transcriptional regulator [Sphingomonadaceae bacterium]